MRTAFILSSMLVMSVVAQAGVKNIECTPRLFGNPQFSGPEKDFNNVTIQLADEGSAQVGLGSAGSLTIQYHQETGGLLFSGYVIWKNSNGTEIGRSLAEQAVYTNMQPAPNTAAAEVKNLGPGTWSIAMLICSQTN